MVAQEGARPARASDQLSADSGARGVRGACGRRPPAEVGVGERDDPRSRGRAVVNGHQVAVAPHGITSVRLVPVPRLKGRTHQNSRDFVPESRAPTRRPGHTHGRRRSCGSAALRGRIPSPIRRPRPASIRRKNRSFTNSSGRAGNSAANSVRLGARRIQSRSSGVAASGRSGRSRDGFGGGRHRV